MRLNRREFLALASAGLAAELLSPPSLANLSRTGGFKAVVFDAFPIFDPRSIVVLAEGLFPGRGRELCDAWRTRQFEYTWLRTLSRSYVDFERITSDALSYATRALNMNMDVAVREQLLQAHVRLKAWPDVLSALTALKNAGLRLGFLSNFTRGMLETNIRNAGLDGFFDHVLSTDLAKAFKPDPRAYQMGIDAFGLKRAEVLFVAFAGWDAAGARRFGYPTFWANRLNAPAEELDAPPDYTGSIADLVTLVLR